MCKTVSQEAVDENPKKLTVISTICENDQIRLVKRIKGTRDNIRNKIKNPPIQNKGDRKSSIKTLLEDSGPSFSFNVNMLYPKNVLTYSAYCKNMEAFVK